MSESSQQKSHKEHVSLAKEDLSNNCMPHEVVAPCGWQRASKGWVPVSGVVKKDSTSGARVSQMVFPGLLFLYIYL